VYPPRIPMAAALLPKRSAQLPAENDRPQTRPAAHSSRQALERPRTPASSAAWPGLSVQGSDADADAVR
jgi:hypothetical protein